MEKLIDLISSNENWLMQRILDYAKARDYTKYTSTLVEAWKLSISGLSESLIKGLNQYMGIPELTPDEDYSKDPIAAFGILEAQRHRDRGITLSMFLGLMKYYRQSYVDLIKESNLDNNYKETYIIYINRFFDRLEIGFTSEWNQIGEKNIIEDLQSKNRFMVNEKNKYLTIFDSLNAPMFFLNKENIIENLNYATSEYFDFYKTSGEKYYEVQKKEMKLKFIEDEILEFRASNLEKAEFEKSILTKKGLCYFQVKMNKMLDVSDKFFGTVIILNDLTELKNTSALLKESEEKFRSFAEQSVEGIVLIDSNGRIVEWNKSVEKITGLIKEQILGKYIWDVQYETMLEEFKSEEFYNDNKKRINEFLKNKDAPWLNKQIENIIITPKGEIKNIQTIVFPVQTKERFLFGSVIVDITERKKAEESLKKSEERYKNIVKDQTEFITRFNSDGIHTFVNDAYCNYMNMKREDLIGKSFFSFLPKEDYEKLKSLLDSLTYTDPIKEIEHKYIIDDKPRFLHWINRAIFDDYGNLIEYQAVGRDITDKKLIEDELKKSEEKYRELVENANSIILKFDKEGKILSMNEFGLKFFGYSEKELIGKYGIGTIIPEVESSGRELKKLITDMVNLESRYGININENIKKNGEKVWIYWTNKPLKDEKGNVQGILCIGTDITERKKAEDKVKELNEILRILNKILRHDILNDLTIVLTVCDLMDNADPNLKMKASRAIGKSVNLIERMRELEQALISDSPIQKYEIDQVIQDITKNYPEIKFNVNGTCNVCTDEAIFSVLDNIIRNAIIHGKTKKIKIDIRQTAKYCEVKIADYGIGIPDEIKSQIFEEGFSYGEARSTGLGLYIVKKIMERYGGSVKVTDNKPSGTIFILEYPNCMSKNTIC